MPYMRLLLLTQLTTGYALLYFVFHHGPPPCNFPRTPQGSLNCQLRISSLLQQIKPIDYRVTVLKIMCNLTIIRAIVTAYSMTTLVSIDGRLLFMLYI